MTPVSDKAFAVMAVCPEAKKYYGITVDYLRKNAYKFVWAFKIDKDKAKVKDMRPNVFMAVSSLIQSIPVVPIAKVNNSFFALVAQ